MIITQKYFLHFPVCETNTPIIYKLVKDYDLEVNIFRALVSSEGEGYLVLDVKGEAGSIKKAMEYIESFGVTINSVKKPLQPLRKLHFALQDGSPAYRGSEDAQDRLRRQALHRLRQMRRQLPHEGVLHGFLMVFDDCEEQARVP